MKDAIWFAVETKGEQGVAMLSTHFAPHSRWKPRVGAKLPATYSNYATERVGGKVVRVFSPEFTRFMNLLHAAEKAATGGGLTDLVMLEMSALYNTGQQNPLRETQLELGGSR